MPVQTRLRGFEPCIPEDLQVTFCDDLPPDAVCAQCDNVSASLHRDPIGHGYCTSCMKMCLNKQCFECFACRNNYHVSQLKIDHSPRTKLGMKRIICPKATKEKPVHISFNALQDHLKSCSCDQVPQADEGNHHQSSLACDKYAGAEQPAAVFSDSSTLALQREETLFEIRNIKTEILELRKGFDQKERDIQLLTERVQSQEIDMSSLKTLLSQKESDIQLLTETVQSHATDMKNLQEELAQKEGRIQLLKDTLQSNQTDMKDIQAEGENRHEKTEKLISAMQGMFESLEKTVFIFNEKTKARLQTIEDMLKNMDKDFQVATLMELQDESKRTQDGLEECNYKLCQLKSFFDNLVRQLSPPDHGP